ncbi:hypothetical protein D3C76_1021740 [compost metagenome]
MPGGSTIDPTRYILAIAEVDRRNHVDGMTLVFNQLCGFCSRLRVDVAADDDRAFAGEQPSSLAPHSTANAGQ